MLSYDIGDKKATAADRITAGIGVSEADDSAEAGRTAAAQALAQLDGATPALVMVYSSIRYDLPALLRAVRGVTGAAPLVGASTSGHFHNGTITEPGRGVAVLVLTAGPYRFGISSVSGVAQDAFNAGRDLARTARAASGTADAPYAAMMMLVDGLAGHQQALLNGIHKVVGAAVPVVGGGAGDDRLLSRTYVFDGDTILDHGGAVAVWIASPWPLAVAAAHGWQPVGLPMLVTKVDGPVVHEVAGRPAVEVFREHFRYDEVAQEPGWVRAAEYHSAHAFGLIEPDGTQLIRGAFVDDDGLLRTFSPLPTYSAVQIVSCQASGLLSVVDGVIGRATAGRDASVVLAFSCAARLDVLTGDGTAEAARIQAAAGTMPTFGFYTYGEYARTNRVAGYHNATLAAIAL